MKEIHFIHISDIHFRLGWEENQGKVLNAFFNDLAIQVKQLASADVYFILGNYTHLHAAVRAPPFGYT